VILVGAVWKFSWPHAENTKTSAKSSMQIAEKTPREEVILRPRSILP